MKFGLLPTIGEISGLANLSRLNSNHIGHTELQSIEDTAGGRTFRLGLLSPSWAKDHRCLIRSRPRETYEEAEPPSVLLFDGS
jgi:hypothetical protein